MSFFVLVRGGGDIASGVVLRLHRAGLRVAVAEIAQPLAVRRKVAFAEAVYEGEMTIEGVTARRVTDFADTFRVLQIFAKSQVPVLIDPLAESIKTIRPTVLVDARMRKEAPELSREAAHLYIGLGPGFEAGYNCHAVVETNRGPFLGRVYWQGPAEADTRLPDPVQGYSAERVLRAPAEGVIEAQAEIGDRLRAGQLIARVGVQPVAAPFDGVLRGLIRPGLAVTQGLKIGDVDPRNDPRLCCLVSDKALAVGGGVLEAILARPNLRPLLWT
jgi:xanthine dehydrogenase accessory factor